MDCSIEAKDAGENDNSSYFALVLRGLVATTLETLPGNL